MECHKCGSKMVYVDVPLRTGVTRLYQCVKCGIIKSVCIKKSI